MKKHLMFLTGLLFAFSLLHGQAILNGNFEKWISHQWEDPDGVQSSNGETSRKGGFISLTKSTDKYDGQFAVKLETKILMQDTAFGYFIFGNFDDRGPSGGYPYSQAPSSITGYYKCDIKTGDSAVIIVAFRKGGNAITMETFKIGGAKTAFTPFSFKLVQLNGATPDSVVIAVASSTPKDIDPKGTPKDGSWIILDGLKFTGNGITQQVPNTDFEKWHQTIIEEPDAWHTRNMDIASLNKKQAEKTTDKYKGNFALKMNTVVIDPLKGYVVFEINNGHERPDHQGYSGGSPFTVMTDTLIGYYKYTPHGSDSAAIMLEFTKAGVNVWDTYHQLPAATAYTKFEIPVSLPNAADSVVISIGSSSWPVDASNDGSSLIIDELQFKSRPLLTGVEERTRRLAGTLAYPNPAEGYVNLEFSLEQNQDVVLSVFDISGRLVHEKYYTEMANGKTNILLNTSGLAPGTYFYSLSDKTNRLQNGKFEVK